MRAIIQRVDRARVTINGEESRSIGRGLMILVGIEHADNQQDLQWLAKKIAQLRIFDDDKGVMNLAVTGVDGEVMVVSQFTLHAKTKKGNRPSYVHAAPPEIAIPLYEAFIAELAKHIEKEVVTGEFGAHMKIDMVNNGPVTIFIDTKNKE